MIRAVSLYSGNWNSRLGQQWEDEKGEQDEQEEDIAEGETGRFGEGGGAVETAGGAEERKRERSRGEGIRWRRNRRARVTIRSR